MQRVFLTVIDMSIVSGLVILAVLAVRALLKKAPRRFSYVLWAAVLVRLLCPVAVESPFSLIPESAGEIAQSAALPESEDVSFVSAASAAYRAIGDTANGGRGVIDVGVEPRTDAEAGGIAGEAGRQYVSATHGQVWLMLCAWLWPAGSAAVLVWGIAGQIKLRRMLIGAVRLEGNVWLADHIPTAFVMGLARPRIYLPSGLEGPGRDYVIEHERAHIRRGDHITRLLAFAALAVHWFNPLVWLAFAMSGRDMEMSCDEAVMRRSGEDIRADYCQTLLDMSANRHFPSPCLLAFGEGDTGARVRNALKWRKPALWAGIGAAVLIVVACVLLLTNPARGENTLIISFPAYQDGRDSGTAYDPVYDFGPFNVSMELPKGWTVSPPGADGDGGSPGAGECPLYTPLYLYDEKGEYAGVIGWSDFEVYTDSDVPEGDYYKTVYYALRLGAHYAWTDFELVKSDDKGETHTAAVYWQEELEDVPAAAWPQHTAPGICSYDRDLGVYVCVQLDGAGATEKEISELAESLELSAGGSGELTALSFSGYDYTRNPRRGVGEFSAVMYLPEGWSVGRPENTDSLPDAHYLLDPAYIYDENGRCAAVAAWAGFDPGYSAEDTTGPDAARSLKSKATSVLMTKAGWKEYTSSDYNTDKDSGSTFVSEIETWDDGPTDHCAVFAYDRELESVVCIEFTDKSAYGWAARRIARSITLRAGSAGTGGVGIGFSGAYSEEGEDFDCGEFTAELKLPAGWTVVTEREVIAAGFKANIYDPVRPMYILNADGRYMGYATGYTFDPTAETRSAPDADRSAAEIRRDALLEDLTLKTSLCWEGYELLNETQDGETFLFDRPVYDSKTGREIHVFILCRTSARLNAYVCIVFSGENDEKVVSQAAESLILRAGAPSEGDGQRVEVSFPGHYIEDGEVHNPGSFIAAMTLPEGWKLSSNRAGGGWRAEGYGSYGYSYVYIYNALGREVGEMSYREFDPDGPAPVVRAGSWSDADYERTRYCRALYLNGAWRDFHSVEYSDSGETFTADVKYTLSVNDEYGYREQTYTRYGVCRYEKGLNVYLAIELDTGAVNEADVALIAQSLDLWATDESGASAGPLSGELWYDVPGYYAEAGWVSECPAFSVGLTLPEGWTAVNGASEPADHEEHGMHSLTWLYADGEYAGTVVWDELSRMGQANHYTWEDLKRIAGGETEVYTEKITYDLYDESLLPGHPWKSFDTLGIRAENEKLGVYVVVQFAPGFGSEEELEEIGRSIRLAKTETLVAGFGGAAWGASVEWIMEYATAKDGSLCSQWAFNGRECVAYYEIDPNAGLNGGSYSFNEGLTLSLEEKAELYSELMEELTAMYGEPEREHPNEKDGTASGIQAVIDGDHDDCHTVWSARAPDGRNVDILLELDRTGYLGINYSIEW